MGDSLMKGWHTFVGCVQKGCPRFSLPRDADVNTRIVEWYGHVHALPSCPRVRTVPHCTQ